MSAPTSLQQIPILRLLLLFDCWSHDVHVQSGKGCEIGTFQDSDSLNERLDGRALAIVKNAETAAYGSREWSYG